eukprot:TRINITY_DN25985_c0_g1_i1.p1 TRINITY_DN25985_c0_g1~~TRINITY_DN25985_c0_g1_i1.p1  ORF type:complete len:470 (-),score=72.55 TRINITY_DN25985_c0_g1_i1:142-1551(-)
MHEVDSPRQQGHVGLNLAVQNESLDQWSSDPGGCVADISCDSSGRIDVLVAYVEHLSSALKNHGDQILAIENRHTSFDRRLTELNALVQGIQEEQCTMNYACTVPSGGVIEQNRQKAFQRQAETVQGIGGFVPQLRPGMNAGTGHGGNSLDALGQLLTIGRQGHQQQHGLFGNEANGPNGSSALVVADRSVGGNANSSLVARIDALERDQKTVAVGVHRALQAALATRQEIHARQQQQNWQQCLEGLDAPVAELEQKWGGRINEQDVRLERIINMVDSLADKCSNMKGTNRLTNGEKDEDASLRERLEDLEVSLMALATSHASRAQPITDAAHVVARDDNKALMEHVDHFVNSVNQRFDALQDDGDEQRLAIRQLGKQLPETVERLDQLWAQCHLYFPRIKEQDVKMNLFQTSFESHKQFMLEAVNGYMAKGGETREVPTGTIWIGGTRTQVNNSQVPQGRGTDETATK